MKFRRVKCTIQVQATSRILVLVKLNASENKLVRLDIVEKVKTLKRKVELRKPRR